MAFSLGSLVQTAGQAVDKHRQLQRQHDQDILQRALITAQIGELSGRHGPQGFTLPAGATRYGPDGKPIASSPARPSSGVHPFASGPGEPIYNIALDDHGRPIATPVGVPGGQGGTLVRPAIDPKEVATARRAGDALRQFVSLYSGNSGAAETGIGTAVLEGAGNVLDKVGLGGGAHGAAQATRTDPQQAFQRAAVQLRHNAAALSPHARLQLGFLEDINKAYVPPPGTSAQVIREQYLPEWQSLLAQMDQLLGQSSSVQAPTRPTRTPVNPASPQASTAAPDWRSLRPHD